MMKIDPVYFPEVGVAHPDRHIEINGWRGPIALDGDIDAQIDALPLTDEEKATAKVEIREGWTTLQGRADDTFPPPTALEVWEREMLRLDKLMLDPRTIEELVTIGTVPQARKDKLAPLIAARAAHRAIYPQ